MKRQENIYKMIISAVCLSLAYALPFLTGQVPEIGSMLCPMHIPVLLCGFICGWQWGGVVGFIAPLSRSLILGAPIFFPNAICMAFELAAYGISAGIMNKVLPQKKLYIYCSLVISMIFGRIVWGISMAISLGLTNKSFGFSAFLAGALTNAVPGIIAQLIIIPLIVIAVNSLNIFKNPEI